MTDQQSAAGNRRQSPRVILITGASAGIGAALARELARSGQAKALVLTARRGDRLEQLAAELGKLNDQLEIQNIVADLADPSAPATIINRCLERFGGLDVLINNAGLGLPTLFADADPALLANQIAVNFTSPLLLARLALPSLIERKGTLINIGSAITTVPNSALGAYGATKAGLAYWNDALRCELSGRGVTVCLVEPGPIKTEFMDALTARIPAGGEPAPILENNAPWMSADVNEVARRVARLIDHPRRRLSYLKRIVWPLRVAGAVARLCPPLGDWLIIKLQK